MRIIEIAALDNGAHRNQTSAAFIPVPFGWAIVPDDMLCENFPFGNITTEEIDGAMTVTAWEALPIPNPDPAPDEPEEDVDVWDAMAAAYTEGVQQA